MAQSTLSLPNQRPGPFARAIFAVSIAATLLVGVLNVRPLVDRVTGAGMETMPPSAIDTLAGVSDRAATPLDARVASLQETLRDGPERARGPASTQLGLAYLQKVRETGDPSYYPKAETLFHQALAEDAKDIDALTGLGTLALARHQFAEALDWGEQASRLDPHYAAAHGVIADAQIEMGRYEEAVETVQTMVDLRPDLASYSRVSYLRELMGDREGAIVAMEQAATAGSGYPENIAWVQVQLGNLQFDGGFLADAERAYATALAAMPNYAPALAGQGRVAAANGDLSRAAEFYARAVQIVPLPEYVIAYGDVLTAAGETDGAKAQYALVDAIQQMYAANGVNTDLELALYLADHGAPETLPQAAEQARAAAVSRPSITTWDTLAWSLYRAGDLDGAAEASANALKLGTRNALMHFHAGMIAAARGEREAGIRHLETALEINPYFSIRYAPEARATLERLQASEVIL